MSKPSEDRSYEGSSLSSHKKDKKKLIPPLLRINNLKPTPWLHNRLPEMLWAVLVIGNLERDKALDFFRYIGKYVGENKEYFDVSLTGLGKLPPEKIRNFVKYMLDWSEEIPNILRALRLYPEIPASDIWNELLEEPVPEEDGEKLFYAVKKTFFHQSREATDCRWVRILCMITGEKLTYSSDMEEIVKEIIEYPNYGDIRKVRPTIRSMEICFGDEALTWSKKFWEHNYTSTDCIPEEKAIDKLKTRQEDFSKELKNSREHFINEIKRVRNKLFTHFFESVNDTRVVPRHETSFGLAIYGFTLFTEIIFNRDSSSITGRLALRSLIEIYITFKYLLKKEQDLAEIWNDFHDYGTGQTKLIFLKLQEVTQQSYCIELDELNLIANEDISVEFIPINLGHWGSSDLRKMSDYAGIKEIYDLYYNYTSGFVHGNRGAIRESVYQMCLNPLHRYHRIPQINFPLMPSVTLDSVRVVNNILECLNLAYPSFDDLIILTPDKEETVTKEE
jgi:hypothetical protein